MRKWQKQRKVALTRGNCFPFFFDYGGNYKESCRVAVVKVKSERKREDHTKQGRVYLSFCEATVRLLFQFDTNRL